MLSDKEIKKLHLGGAIDSYKSAWLYFIKAKFYAALRNDDKAADCLIKYLRHIEKCEWYLERCNNLEKKQSAD